MTEQGLIARAQLRIAKTTHEVFEAIVDPAQMARYFISSGSARLDGGAPVTWKWDDFGAEALVTPRELVADRSIAFMWAGSGSEAEVTLELVANAGGTLVKVEEGAWPCDAEGAARCMQQTGGWMHMLCCLKAYLEYDINLREGGVVNLREGGVVIESEG